MTLHVCSHNVFASPFAIFHPLQILSLLSSSCLYSGALNIFVDVTNDVKTRIHKSKIEKINNNGQKETRKEKYHTQNFENLSLFRHPTIIFFLTAHKRCPNEHCRSRFKHFRFFFFFLQTYDIRWHRMIHQYSWDDWWCLWFIFANQFWIKILYF